MWYEILRFFKHRKARRAMQNVCAPSSIPTVEPLPDDAPDFHQLGRAGEEEACHLLEQEGYLILFRNWRASHWEVDIIAQQGHVIAFVEVKTRQSMLERNALEAIDGEKLFNLKRAIGQFRSMYPEYAQFEFHVDAVTALGSQPPFRMRHYVHPFRKRFEDHQYGNLRTRPSL